MNSTELEKEYRSISPLCDQFGRELTRQFEELLSLKEVALGFPLQYRVKTIESFLQKIERRSLEIHSVREMSDLIGVRIILIFKRDVDAVRTLIKKHFKVYSEEDTQTRLGEGEFGYASVHFIVGLQPSWKKIPTFKAAGEFKAEIQVRTVAQHIWAAASHILQYKQETNVPPPVRRSIYRVSALLETVDLEFERVLDERGTYRSKASTSTAKEELNVDSLSKSLEELFPKENKTGNEDFANLLKDLSHFSIRTPQQLRELVTKNLEAALKDDRLRVAEIAKHSPESAEVKKGCYFSLAGLTRRAMANEFGHAWQKYREEKRKRQIEAKSKKT